MVTRAIPVLSYGALMIQPLDIFFRLAAAAALSGIIGVNRGRLEWTAGLRTHMLVGVGAALAIIVSAFGFADVLAQEHVVLDPSRIAAQVISGIGFLGAGTILFVERDQIVRGLTTAASLWAVASVGLAAGGGLYVGAIIATAIIWVILALLKPLEKRLVGRKTRRPRMIVKLTSPTALTDCEDALARHPMPVTKIVLRREDSGPDTLFIAFSRPVSVRQMAALGDVFRDIDGVGSVEYRHGADDSEAMSASSQASGQP